MSFGRFESVCVRPSAHARGFTPQRSCLTNNVKVLVSSNYYRGVVLDCKIYTRDLRSKVGTSSKYYKYE